MKRLITNFVACAMLTMTIVPATITISQAKATYNVSKLRAEGFRACKAQGNSGYTAIVQGTSLHERSIFQDKGFAKFFVRSCFSTRAQCNNYLKSFTKRLAGVNEITYRSCKSRG